MCAEKTCFVSGAILSLKFVCVLALRGDIVLQKARFRYGFRLSACFSADSLSVNLISD